MKYQIYGFIHRVAKKLLGRLVTTDAYRFVNAPIDMRQVRVVNDNAYINEIKQVPEFLSKEQLYPVENVVKAGTFDELANSFVVKKKCKETKLGIVDHEACDVWLHFIDNSTIPEGYRNGGLHYAGFIYECDEWCLPSWIWTNAALVRMYCSLEMIEKATQIGDKLLTLQDSTGGWIVRYDYDSEGIVPVLAPNDSAYIANNALIELYLHTKDIRYLNAAEECASWIMNNAREDGMVYIGYDLKRKQWEKSHNIVDIGFTGGLFSRLYDITGKREYVEYLEKFVKCYIKLFFDKNSNGFATGLDSNDKQIGGMFGRGQAWALEGLIPAYKILQFDYLKNVIETTINNLLKLQDKKGGWPYNLSRPLMGIDCKATSVIALSLMNWFQMHPEQYELKESAQKAYDWCVKHTLPSGKGKGGIYSYTTEGAIVHHMYTWTAFVYGSSYAIELKKILHKY